MTLRHHRRHRNGLLHALASALCMCAVTWLPFTMAAADTTVTAREWLASSEQSVRSAVPSGVYEQFAVAKIALAQARVYALLGDVERTLPRLPPTSGKQPGWSSGGGGMVRMLLVDGEVRQVHESLLGALVAAGRDQEAIAHARSLAKIRHGEDAYQWLGHALAASARGNTAPATAGAVTPRHQVAFQVGVARALFEHGNDDGARGALARLSDPRLRADAMDGLAASLMLRGENELLRRVLRAVGTADGATPVMLVETLLYAGDPEAAAEMISRIEDPQQRDSNAASVALTLAAAGNTDAAARIFDAAQSRRAPRWEQVALRLGRRNWLESRYGGISSPWRRSERLFQLARQTVKDGDAPSGLRLAALSQNAAEAIPGETTRWLAFGAIAGVHAMAGEVDSAIALARRIPVDDPRGRKHRGEAQAEVAAALAKRGDVVRARQVAGAIAEPSMRVRGLAGAARSAHPRNAQHYQELVDAARAACGQLSGQPSKAHDAAWTTLLKMQLGIGDLSGAELSAEKALAAGAGAPAYETLVEHHINERNLNAAARAARAVPQGVDDRVGYDRRQRALGKVTEAAAEGGQTRVAVELLAEIALDPERELRTDRVVESLMAAGDESTALSLLRELRRGDARHNSLAVIIPAMLRRGVLPDANTVMGRVPERYGGGLCWAAAAAQARNMDSSMLQTWLSALPGPLCRAFAFAGAAYGITASPPATGLEELFAAVDPHTMEARMGRAMGHLKPRAATRQ